MEPVLEASDCGAIGQPACDGMNCDQGIVDIYGNCAECGGEYQAPCAGSSCNSGLEYWVEYDYCSEGRG